MKVRASTARPFAVYSPFAVSDECLCWPCSVKQALRLPRKGGLLVGVVFPHPTDHVGDFGIQVGDRGPWTSVRAPDAPRCKIPLFPAPCRLSALRILTV